MMLYCTIIVHSSIYNLLHLVLRGLFILYIPACCGFYGHSPKVCVISLPPQKLVGSTMLFDSASDTLPMSSISSGSFRVLGVCGGIGSGKSTASKLLVSSCNCLKHIDADSIAHSIYAPGSQAIRDVVATFGNDILLRQDDGKEEKDIAPIEIDRKKLGEIVFAEQSAMTKLEKIIWPHVKTLLIDEISLLRQKWEAKSKEFKASSNKRPIVVLEAAVLIDAGWEDILDGVWVVTVPREIALTRLTETRGLTIEEARKRIEAQESRRGIGNLQQEKDSGVVTGEIKNDNSLDDLTRSLKRSLDDPDRWKC
mmetsp:Transcript_53758/g.60053  ORF Transcript_53758/g.60053 Transcript_53758/m.60053 type:complete len:310 (+) Transcript_53758:59-988(+)